MAPTSRAPETLPGRRLPMPPSRADLTFDEASRRCGSARDACGCPSCRLADKAPPTAPTIAVRSTGVTPVAQGVAGNGTRLAFLPPTANTRLRYVGYAQASWDPDRAFGVSTYASSIMNETVDLATATKASTAQVAEARASILQFVPTEDRRHYPSHGVDVSAATTFRVDDPVYGAETAGLRTGGATARLLWRRGGRFWTEESPVEGFMDLCGRLLVTYNRFILQHGQFNPESAYRPFGIRLDGTVGTLMAFFVTEGFADVALSFGRKLEPDPPEEDDPPLLPRFTRTEPTWPPATIEELVIDEVQRGTTKKWVYRGLAVGPKIYLSRQMVVDMAVVCDELLYQALRVQLVARATGLDAAWVYASRLRQLALAPALYVAKVWLHEAIHTRFATNHPEDGCVEELAAFRWRAMVSSILGVPSCDVVRSRIILDSGFSEYVGTSSTCADDNEQRWSTNGNINMCIGRSSPQWPAYGAEPRISRAYLAVPGVALATL